MPKYIHPTVRHDVSDSFEDHRNRRPPSVNPGTDFKTWDAPYFTTYKRPVFAVADGTVRVVSRGSGIWYVEYVDIYGVVHQDLHVSEIGVSVGERLTQGQVIAITGDTGAPGSPHLHHSMKINGVNVDFMLYVDEDDHADAIAAKPAPYIGDESEMNLYRSEASGKVALVGEFSFQKFDDVNAFNFQAASNAAAGALRDRGYIPVVDDNVLSSLCTEAEARGKLFAALVGEAAANAALKAASSTSS